MASVEIWGLTFPTTLFSLDPVSEGVQLELERPDILTRASDLQEISPARASTRRDALAGRNSEHT